MALGKMNNLSAIRSKQFIEAELKRVLPRNFDKTFLLLFPDYQ
jgi:hypothetical protein